MGQKISHTFEFYMMRLLASFLVSYKKKRKTHEFQWVSMETTTYHFLTVLFKIGV